jgi:hypothetical protein
MKVQLGARIRLAVFPFAGVLLFLVHGPAAKAQSREPLKFFREYAGLDEGQISAIRNGRAVAKILESRTPDEVFVCSAPFMSSPLRRSTLRWRRT